MLTLIVICTFVAGYVGGFYHARYRMQLRIDIRDRTIRNIEHARYVHGKHRD